MERKEAIEIVRKLYNDSLFMKKDKEAMVTLIPELKESEDERIRRELIRDIDIAMPIATAQRYIAWLEKQGEQKPTIIIPKFKAGDIIRHKKQGFTCKIIAVDTEYRLSECSGTHLPFDSQDAYELVEQNPAWSEEDEDIRDDIIRHLKRLSGDMVSPNQTYQKEIQWLKSLKDRVQPKVELTQLDKNILEAAIAFVKQNNHFNCWGGVDKHTVLSALHSLSPQSTWKPSDEQIIAIQESIGIVGELTPRGERLKELVEQLKKLREV